MIAMHPIVLILLVTLASFTVAEVLERGSVLLLNFTFKKAHAIDGVGTGPVLYE